MGALRFDGINDTVTLPTLFTVNWGNTNVVVEFRVALTTYPTSGNKYFTGLLTGSTNEGLCLRQASGDGALAYVAGGTNQPDFTSNPGYILNDGALHTYRIERDASVELRFYRDGTLFQTKPWVTSSNFSLRIQRFGMGSTTTSGILAHDFEYFKIITGGSPSNEEWNANLSGGTGNSLPSTSNAHNGTLVNFPTDNTQWVGFGGTAQSVTLTDAQVLQQAQQISVVVSQAIGGVNAQVLQQAQQISVVVSQAIGGVNAQVLQQAQQASITVSQAIAGVNAQVLQQAQQISIAVSQAIGGVNAQVLQQAQQISAVVNQAIASVNAQQSVEAQQVTISQSGAIPAQDVVTNAAQTLNQAQQVIVTVSQNINIIDAEQRTEAQSVTISTTQAVVITPAQQSVEAQQVTISQSGAIPAQGVVVNTAQQLVEAVAINVIVSQGIAIIGAESVAEGDPAIITTVQQVVVNTAQQLTEAIIAGDTPTQPIIVAKVKVTLKPASFTMNATTPRFKITR